MRGYLPSVILTYKMGLWNTQLPYNVDSLRGFPCFTHDTNINQAPILDSDSSFHWHHDVWYLHWMSFVYDIHMYIFEPFLKMSFETYLVNCLSICFFMDFWHFFPYPSIYIYVLKSLLPWFPCWCEIEIAHIHIQWIGKVEQGTLPCRRMNFHFVWLRCEAHLVEQKEASLLVLNWHKRLKALNYSDNNSRSRTHS